MNYNKYNSWASYRLAQLKDNGLWNIAMRTVRYARRYFLVSRIIRYMSYVIAAVETSALLILLFSALLILLPVIAILFTLTAILSTISYRKYDKLIGADVKYADKIAIIDAKKGYFRRKERYLNRMARCFRDEGYTVMVVSHSHVTDPFLTARKADEKIWVVKLNYFFSLKKLLNDENITFIY